MNQLLFDLARCDYLAQVSPHWGPPSDRLVVERGGNRIEIFGFAATTESPISRYATFGCTSSMREDGGQGSHEFFLVVDPRTAGLSSDELLDAVASIAAYYLDECPDLDLPTIVPEATAFGWKQTAILFDEPRGEPHDLEGLHIAGRHVQLVWAVPIFDSERRCIEERGMEEFDRRARSIPNALIDLSRAPIG